MKLLLIGGGGGEDAVAFNSLFVSQIDLNRTVLYVACRR